MLFLQYNYIKLRQTKTLYKTIRFTVKKHVNIRVHTFLSWSTRPGGTPVPTNPVLTRPDTHSNMQTRTQARGAGIVQVMASTSRQVVCVRVWCQYTTVCVWILEKNVRSLCGRSLNNECTFEDHLEDSISVCVFTLNLLLIYFMVIDIHWLMTMSYIRNIYFKYV